MVVVVAVATNVVVVVVIVVIVVHRSKLSKTIFGTFFGGSKLRIKDHLVLSDLLVATSLANKVFEVAAGVVDGQAAIRS